MKFTPLCVILLVVPCTLGSYYFIVENKDTLEDHIAANVISMFSKHNILFHYDSISRDRVDSIINKIVYSNCILMASYDQGNDTSKSLIRPTGHKFLHVVLLQNYSTFQEYTTSSIYSFEYLDIVLVITDLENHNISNETYFDIFIENVNRAGSFFLFDDSNSTLYSNCFYCGEKSQEWKLVASLSNATDQDYLYAKLMATYIYQNQFSNFSGHVFAVGYTIYRPFFWCELVQKDNESWIQVAGSEGELLFTLQEKLNVYFDLIEIIDIDNSWSSITESVKNGTFDWVVGGVTASNKRVEMMEFTSSINDEPFIVMYSLFDNPWMSWLFIAWPFSYSVWIALFSTAFTVATILFVIMHLARNKPKRMFKYSKFIQGVLRYLVEQPIPIVRRYMRTRWIVMFIMTLWLLVAQIMTNAYKSKITAALINIRGLEHNSIDDLLNKDYNFYIYKDDLNMVRESLEVSKDSGFLKILGNLETFDDMCAQILHLDAKREAIIGQDTIIQYLVRKICLPILNAVDTENLRLLNEILIPCTQAWPMAKNVPYIVAVNTLIARLNAGGIIMKWNKDYALTARTVLRSNERRSKNYQSTKPKFTMKSIIGPLFLWVLGIVLSTIAFLNEIRLGKNIC